MDVKRRGYKKCTGGVSHYGLVNLPPNNVIGGGLPIKNIKKKDKNVSSEWGGGHR